MQVPNIHCFTEYSALHVPLIIAPLLFSLPLTVFGLVGALMTSVFGSTFGLLLGSSAVASTLVLLTPLPWLLFALNVLASACLGLCT